MSKITDQYLNNAIMSGKVPFFKPETAIQIIQDCKKENIRILGLDAVRMTNSMTQPDMDHSVDYSDKQEAWDEAIAFIRSRAELGLLFEVVCGDEPSNVTSNPSLENLKLSHFEKSDGWLLYSFSSKFSDLRSIISTGDQCNHAIFNYDELNGGLLRLIQHGFAEESMGKFRITKKGRSFVRKIRFPFGYMGGYIGNMLYLCDQIAKVKMKVEIDYMVDALSLDEYQKAIKAYSSMFGL